MARRPLDLYETPPDYVETLLRAVDPYGLIVEPCAGGRAIAKHLTANATVVTNDIDKGWTADYHYDATEPDLWETVGTCDWTITNPPFTPSLMVPILEWALECSQNVVTLARLTFLEPTVSRQTFWSDNPPSMVIVLPRYSFTGKGNDSATCCWIGWGPKVPQTFAVETTTPQWRKRK